MPSRLCQNASSPDTKGQSVIPAKAGIQGSWRGPHAPFPHSTPPGFPLSRPCQNCPLSLWERVGVRATPTAQAAIDPLSLWERVGVRATPTAQAAIDPLSLWERVGVREPRGKQAGVNGNEWERQGYWGPSPGLRPPSPRGRGVGFGAGRTGLRPPSPRGRGVGFGTGRTGLRPPSPRGRGVGFGAGRASLRPPSPRGRGVGFETGRTGLRPPSPRGRGVEFGTGRTGLRPPAKQAVPKRQFPGTKGQSVIPAKAGIQGSWRGPHARFPHSAPPGFPLTRPCQDCPLSLWERVGVREPRGKQAGVNGKERERQGYWGPSPGLRPPSPRGRGVGFGTGRTGLRPPAKQAVSKRQFPGTKGQSVIPAKAGIQGWWRGPPRAVSPLHPAWIPRLPCRVKTAPSPSRTISR